MDLHARTGRSTGHSTGHSTTFSAFEAIARGRPMLLARGGVALVVGIVAVNQPGASAAGLVVLWGLWALAEGAATIRQAYPASNPSGRAEHEPVLMAMGASALLAGLLALALGGLSAAAMTWVIASWLVLRSGFEVLGARAASTKPRRLMLVAAVVDLGIAALLVTHTSGSVTDAALFGGGLVAFWGALYLALGVLSKPDVVVTAPGPRLLSGR